MSKQFWVYILTNSTNSVLYIGVTNNIKRRVFEHRSGKGGAFTSKYHIWKLVYSEVSGDVRVAIGREKQLKNKSREKKIELVNSVNPEWNDLF